jgi:hypothetical protein
MTLINKIDICDLDYSFVVVIVVVSTLFFEKKERKEAKKKSERRRRRRNVQFPHTSGAKKKSKS